MHNRPLRGSLVAESVDELRALHAKGRLGEMFPQQGLRLAIEVAIEQPQQRGQSGQSADAAITAATKGSKPSGNTKKEEKAPSNNTR